jgi:hypothetical protein
MNISIRTIARNCLARPWWLATGVCLACYIALRVANVFLPIGVPSNPFREEFHSKNLKRIQVRFIGNGAELFDWTGVKTSKGAWFDLPIDVWATIEPIAHEAHFTTYLSPKKMAIYDLAEVVLESSRNTQLKISLLLVTDSCSCFVFRKETAAFVYENRNKEITTHFLSHVASNAIAEFKCGDSPKARTQAKEYLDVLSRVAEAIKRGKPERL